MSVTAAKKVLKRSLKALDERKNPTEFHMQTALLYLAGAIDDLGKKLDRLEAQAGTAPPIATARPTKEAGE